MEDVEKERVNNQMLVKELAKADKMIKAIQEAMDKQTQRVVAAKKSERLKSKALQESRS